MLVFSGAFIQYMYLWFHKKHQDFLPTKKMFIVFLFPWGFVTLQHQKLVSIHLMEEDPAPLGMTQEGKNPPTFGTSEKWCLGFLDPPFAVGLLEFLGL